MPRIRFIRNLSFGGRDVGPGYPEQVVDVEPWVARRYLAKRAAVLVEHGDPVAEHRDPVHQPPVPGTVAHVGGGWYEIERPDGSVERVRGRAEAEHRLAELG